MMRTVVKVKLFYDIQVCSRTLHTTIFAGKYRFDLFTRIK